MRVGSEGVGISSFRVLGSEGSGIWGCEGFEVLSLAVGVLRLRVRVYNGLQGFGVWVQLLGVWVWALRILGFRDACEKERVG